MTLLDHVTIPSSLDLCRWSRESTDSRNERRLRGSGLTPTVCPICNHRATVEELTVTRPGEGTVHRRVLRCQRRSGSWGNGACCPVQVLAEAPAEDAAPLDLTPAPATARRCLDCGCGGLVGNRKRCEPCASEAKRRSTREAQRAQRGCVPRTTCLDCGCDIQPGDGRLRCRPCAEESARRQRHESKRKRRHEARLRSLPPGGPQKPSEAADPPETPPTPPEAVTEHSGRQDDATPGPTPAEEETSMETPTRTCRDCQCDISDRAPNAKRCLSCYNERNRALTRDRGRARREAAREAAPPRALTLSVLDLAAQIRSLPPDVRAIVDDVASLSPERQALLRTVLADAEVQA